MRTTLITLVCFAFIMNVNGQASINFGGDPHSSHPRDSATSVSHNSLPVVYLGLGAGINNYTGIIGVGADIRIHQTLFLRAGVGLGSWGTKTSVGLRYALKYTSGWVFGVTYEYASGLNNFITQLPVDSANTTETRNVNLTLLPVSIIALTASYNWVFHKGNEFFIDMGYCVPLTTNPYVVNSPVVLSSTATSVLSLIQPGGITVGIGIMFGL